MQSFSGDRCDVNIDDCGAHCTANGTGQCVDETAGYHCVCNTGYTGEECEVMIVLKVYKHHPLYINTQYNDKCYNGNLTDTKLYLKR